MLYSCMRHFARNWHNYRFRCLFVVTLLMPRELKSLLHFLVIPRPTFLRVELDFQHGKTCMQSRRNPK